MDEIRGTTWFRGGRDKLRFVLAGCGGTGAAWAKMLSEDDGCEIVALVDPDQRRCVGLAERLRLLCPVFANLEDALGKVEAELVADVTPPDQHIGVAVAAARHGCSVVGEKPLALSLVDGAAIAATMRDAGLFYAVMQNRRYYPGLRSLREAVRKGLLGEVSVVAAEVFLSARPGGFREDMPQPLLWDVGIHTFDAARFVLGTDAVSVCASTSNPPWSWYAGDAVANCSFTMSGGVSFLYRGAMCAAGFATGYNGTWRIVGSAGTAVWDGVSDRVEVELEASGKTERRYGPETPPSPTLDSVAAAFGSYHGACLDEILQAYRGGRPSATDISDNLASVAMVEAAIKSAESGTITPVSSRLDYTLQAPQSRT